MPTVKRWVCSACGAIWFVAPNNKCMSCSAPCTEKDCTLALDGSVKPV